MLKFFKDLLGKELPFLVTIEKIILTVHDKNYGEKIKSQIELSYPNGLGLGPGAVSAKSTAAKDSVTG